MEQVINPNANSGKYILETESKISAYDLKLKELETKYANTIREKDALISQKESLLIEKDNEINNYNISHSMISKDYQNQLNELFNLKFKFEQMKKNLSIKEIKIRNKNHQFIATTYSLIISDSYNFEKGCEYLISGFINIDAPVSSYEVILQNSDSRHETYDLIKQFAASSPFNNGTTVSLDIKSKLTIPEPKFASDYILNNYHIGIRINESRDVNKIFNINSSSLYLINLTKLRKEGFSF